MRDNLGPILIFFGTMFLIAGLIYYSILRRQRNKYPSETLARISTCKKYTQKKGADTDICYALIFDFTVDNKNYQVRRDICKERIGYSDTWKPHSMGEQVKIYYHPENPEKIDVEINNSRKIASILSRVFLYTGLVGLLVGFYLTFYCN